MSIVLRSMEEEEAPTTKKRLAKRKPIQKCPKRNKKCAKDNEEDVQQQCLEDNLQLDGEFSKLTPDILLDIMRRVPIKTLSQCKWVSKSWFKFIHNPFFTYIHYITSIQSNISPCVLLYKKNMEFHLIDHNVFDKFELWAPLHCIEFHQFQETFQESSFEIVGSVNGLICFTSHTKSASPLLYYVCNPVSREYLILPKSPKSRRCPAVSGFGYDEVKNDYKIIRFLQTAKGMKAEAEVYTFGEKSWRKIVDVPFITKRVSSNVFVNGRLHWLSSEVGGFLLIVVFEIGTEEFSRVQPPPVTEHKQKEELSFLGVLGRGLCCFEFNAACVIGFGAIWVMTEDGGEGSWVKQYVFPKEVMPRPLEGCYKVTKLRNGEFLLRNEGKDWGYYDSSSETYRNIVFQNNQRLQVRSMRAEIFAGSLISPKSVGRSMIR